MRLALLFSAVVVVVGVYAASGRLSGHAAPAAEARIVYVKPGDRVVFGKVQCIATVEGFVRNFLCQRRPRSRARYEVAIFPSSILVYRMGNPDPIYDVP